MATGGITPKDVAKKAGLIPGPQKNSPADVKKLIEALVKTQAYKDIGKGTNTVGHSQPQVDHLLHAGIAGEGPTGGSVLHGISDLIQRPLYATANVLDHAAKVGKDAKAGKGKGFFTELKNTVAGAPGAFVRGLEGKDKTTYPEVLKDAGLPSGGKHGILGLTGIAPAVGLVNKNAGKAIDKLGPQMSPRDVIGQVANLYLDPTMHLGAFVKPGATAVERSATLGKTLQETADATKAGAEATANGIPHWDAVPNPKNVAPTGKVIENSAAKEGAKAAEQNTIKDTTVRGIKANGKKGVVHSVMIEGKKAKQAADVAEVLGTKPASLVPSPVQALMDKLKGNAIPRDPREVVPQQGTLFGSHETVNTPIPTGEPVVAPKISRDQGTLFGNEVGQPGPVADAVPSMEPVKKLSPQELRAQLRATAEQTAKLHAAKAGRLAVEDQLPQIGSAAQKAADALPKGTAGIAFHGKPVVSSEALYSLGKGVKDAIPDSIKQVFSTNIARNATTDTVVDSQGLNALRRKTLNATLTEANKSGIGRDEALDLAKARTKEKVLSQYGQQITDPTLQELAKKHGLVDAGNNTYVHPNVKDTLEAWKTERSPVRATDPLSQLGAKTRDAYRTQSMMWPGSLNKHFRATLMNNVIAGVHNPAEIFDAIKGIADRGGDTVVHAAGKDFSLAEVKKMWENEGLSRNNPLDQLHRNITDAIPESELKSNKVVEALKKPVQGVRAATRFNDNALSFAHFLHKFVETGSGEGATVEKAIAEASKSARKFNPDFGDLTPFERKVQKYAPFYSIPRKEIPIALKNIAEHPGQSNLIIKAEQAVQKGLGTGKLVASGIQPSYEKDAPIVGENKNTQSDTHVDLSSMYESLLNAKENPRGLLDPGQWADPVLKALTNATNPSGKDQYGRKNPSVLKQLENVTHIGKLVNDLTDPNNTQNEKRLAIIRALTGINAREVGTTQKMKIAQKQETSAKNNVIASIADSIKHTGKLPANVQARPTIKQVDHLAATEKKVKS